MENRLFRAIVISVVIFSGAFVLASVLLGNRLPDIRGGNEITVTGSAKKRIKSDLIVWRVQIRASAPRLADAFAQINRDTTRVRAFLISKGVPETQLVVSAIDTHINRKGSTTYDDGEAHQNGPILGYDLQQEISVRSMDIDKVSAISREVTQLINEGILIESKKPEYLYTKLADIKVAILADAARDAKARAEQIADNTGSRIGALRNARMGVLQITPPDSTEVTGYGINDTTSLEKDVTAVVNLTFALR
jgi:hypothetical protein